MDTTRSYESISEKFLANGCGLEDHVFERGDPFNTVARREALHQSSAEARALVNIILNAPGEIMRIFGREKSKKMRELHVLSILVKAGKTYDEAVCIMHETKHLVRTFL